MLEWFKKEDSIAEPEAERTNNVSETQEEEMLAVLFNKKIKRGISNVPATIGKNPNAADVSFFHNSVDNVRALRDEAVFSPASVRKRVYIIDEVHMLSSSAFNALLKILEEPPEHLMFILATTELQKVPATILSRCQRHSFKRIDASNIADYLEYIASKESFKLTHDAAGLIARLADGGVRDALSLLDQCSASENIDLEAVYSAMGLAGNRRTIQLMNHVIAHDTAKALKDFNSLWMDG
jgi:DNA polymerase-3 subunit gamma/tau